MYVHMYVYISVHGYVHTQVIFSINLVYSRVAALTYLHAHTYIHMYIYTNTSEGQKKCSKWRLEPTKVQTAKIITFSLKLFFYKLIGKHILVFEYLQRIFVSYI